jgi:hypothetical protein
LFQIEVDATEAIAPQELKTLVLGSVDEVFNETIYRKNLRDREITPTKEDFRILAIAKTKDLLTILQNGD